MFRIPDIDQVAEGQKQTSLTVLDDQEMKFYLQKEQEKNWLVIKKVSMRNSYCTIKSIEDLCSKSVSFAVEELDLSRNFNSVNDMSMDLMRRSEHLRNLRVLDLSDTAVTDEGLDKFLSSVNSKNLRKLILYGNLDITSKTLVSIAATKHCFGIEHLDLRCTGVDDQGIVQLVNHKNCSLLTYLDISSNFESITDQSLAAIASSPHLKFLKVLKVANCKITDAGILSLTTSSVCQELEELDISNEKDAQYNSITKNTMLHLAKQDSATKLQILNLRNTSIDDASLKKYLISANAYDLRWLKISSCQNINGTTLINIIEAHANYCPQLEKLYINDTAIEEKFIKDFVLKCPQIDLVYNSEINFKDLKDNDRLIMNQRNDREK